MAIVVKTADGFIPLSQYRPTGDITLESMVLCPPQFSDRTNPPTKVVDGIPDVELIDIFGWDSFSWDRDNGGQPSGRVSRTDGRDAAQRKCAFAKCLANIKGDTSDNQQNRDSRHYRQETESAADRLELYISRGYAFEEPPQENDDDDCE